MKQKRTFVTLLLVIAILCLGIGYALISNQELTIGGTVTASPDAANFVVKFQDNPTATATKGTATAEKTGDTTGKLTVTGFNATGDSATAVFTVVNESPDLLAKLSVTTSEITDDATDDDEYFEITTSIDEPDTNIAANNGTKEVTVTVKLIKTPISGNVTGTINIELDAAPVQP